MSRGLSSDTIAALSADNINLCTLVEFQFPLVIRLTDYDRSVTALGQTFASGDHLIDIGNVIESSELRVNATSVALSSVDQTYVSLFLGNAYINTKARIWKAALNQSDAIQGEAILIFEGLITGYEINESDTASRLNVGIASHWKNFEKRSGRKTNHNIQQLYFPGDNGFLYASSGGRAPWQTNPLQWGG